MNTSHSDRNDKSGIWRYGQLVSNRFWKWAKTNFLTILGGTTLLAAIVFSVLTAKAAFLFPLCLLGGMIFGPFLAGMYDAVFRGLREEPGFWWDDCRRSWRQNWRESLLPGAVLGVTLGAYAFIGMRLFWWSSKAPNPLMILAALLAFLFLTIINTLYWPQLVLFQQKNTVRIQNCVLICVKHFGQVAAASAMQVTYWLLFILFTPLSVPLLFPAGIWLIVSLSQFMLYDLLNETFQIEEQYRKAGGKGQALED